MPAFQQRAFCLWLSDVHLGYDMRLPASTQRHALATLRHLLNDMRFGSSFSDARHGSDINFGERHQHRQQLPTSSTSEIISVGAVMLHLHITGDKHLLIISISFSNGK